MKGGGGGAVKKKAFCRRDLERSSKQLVLVMVLCFILTNLLQSLFFQNNRIVNMLVSDSTSSLQEERKRVEKSTPKSTRWKLSKSPELKNKKSIPFAVQDNAEGNLGEITIYVENVVENHNADTGKEDVELMDVERYDEENVLLEQHHTAEWDMHVSTPTPDHKPGSLNNW